MRVTLPWIDKRLSPNARLHHMVRAALVKKARADAHYYTLEAAGTSLGSIRADLTGDEPITVRVTFYPPDRRHRDDDGMIASLKAARDGICDALHINDRRWRTEYHVAAPEKPGRVTVEIGA